METMQGYCWCLASLFALLPAMGLGMGMGILVKQMDDGPQKSRLANSSKHSLQKKSLIMQNRRGAEWIASHCIQMKKIKIN